MANLYAGVVETDDVGEATVVLPDYFEALNRDFANSSRRSAPWHRWR
ncbi:hypothetical protein ACIGPN_29180 [Streptomyces afghaniensis]|nr:hypothetical protein [Streptomyces sp. HP-A2021]UOB15361.1 hypothetical protein MQE23_42820 [Streptomyces sp. HP-A2021]